MIIHESISIDDVNKNVIGYIDVLDVLDDLIRCFY